MYKIQIVGQMFQNTDAHLRIMVWRHQVPSMMLFQSDDLESDVHSRIMSQRQVLPPVVFPRDQHLLIRDWHHRQMLLPDWWTGDIWFCTDDGLEADAASRMMIYTHMFPRRWCRDWCCLRDWWSTNRCPLHEDSSEADPSSKLMDQKEMLTRTW